MWILSKLDRLQNDITQIQRVDYENTFSPIAMLKSIRILLAVAAALDYEIWQMGVEMTFLNEKLNEDINMQQPKSFITPGERA